MDQKTLALFDELGTAKSSLTASLKYTSILKVEEFADLVMALEVVRNIYTRLEKAE